MATKKTTPTDDIKPEDDEIVEIVDLDDVDEEDDIDPVVVLEALVEDDDIDEIDEDLDEEDEEDDVDEEAVVVVVPVKEVRRPAPNQRSPMGKDEPPPPFAIGEPVILTQNTRPRTGTPVGNYPVGTHGVVEAVLSLTAIVRFDVPPHSKEVVAFTCLTSALKQKKEKVATPEAEE